MIDNLIQEACTAPYAIKYQINRRDVGGNYDELPENLKGASRVSSKNLLQIVNDYIWAWVGDRTKIGEMSAEKRALLDELTNDLDYEAKPIVEEAGPKPR